MSPSLAEGAPSPSAEHGLAEVIEELTAKLKGQEAVDLPAYLAAHPQHAAELRRLYPALRLLADFSQSGADAVPAAAGSDHERAPLDGTLGDFRLLREVGRGGMGVVYEAEQISLGRRVALKVLPFASTLDPKQLQRFKNEAQAAAHLHHTNIVPVHATGCERGVHFYAMQFIEGETLASVIAQIRKQARQQPLGAELAPAMLSKAAQVLLTSEWSPTAAPVSTPPDSWVRIPGSDLPSGLPELSATTAKAGISTERSAASPAFIRMAAQLGVQAAEALEHAHQLSIVHRDIKPANLLVDCGGNLWITDFGLAHCQNHAGLTMSGDLMGTLRYMSPEQALAKRVPIDHRTDVYSLGVTLYELLTLELVFAGHDRQELLRQIAFEEPKPPRRLNRALPAELETIVLKAMEKNPADRYATAQDLADDLRRFLEDKPIRARRPTLWQKLKKWARRNKPVVWTAAVFTFLVIAVLAGCIGLVVWDRAARYAFITAQVDAALQEAMRLQDQGNWPEALSAVKRAEGILAAGANPALDRRAQEIRQDLEMIVKLERVRLDEPILDRFDWGFRARDAAYSAAFREYGLDVTVAPPEEAVDLIRAKSESVRHELITALEDWAFMGRARTPQRTRLLAIVRMADPDVRRNQLRDALERGDGRVLKQLATSKQVVNLPPLSLKLFGDYLALTGAVDEAVALLQLIQGEYLGNFWINVSLAEWLQMTSPPQFDEAIGYYRAALALRPKNGGLHYFFGTALRRKGSLSQAETAYRRAIEFEPGLADAHSSLVGLLAGQGRVEEADEACAAAQRRIPNFGRWLNNRAWHIVYFPDFHRSDSRLAVECAKKAIEIAPDAKYTWNTLGAAYYRAGEWDKAVAALEKSMEIRQGGDSFDWFFLAMAHQKLGHENQARRWYQQAVEWMEKHAPQDEELRHFRPEAEEVLGIRETKSQPQTNADEHS